MEIEGNIKANFNGDENGWRDADSVETTWK